MGLTTGMLMMYGGIAGMVLFVIVLLILAPVFKKQREKVLDEIQENK